MGRFTFQDAVDHVIDYLGGNPGDNVVRDAKRCVLGAYRDLANAHHWTYYYTHGRIITSGAFAAGTISYDHAGGTYDRMATLAGTTWPDWAGAGCYVRVGQAQYKVSARKSASVLTFDELVNPGDDLPAGTGYKLYRDTYLLPADYQSQDQALYERNFGGLAYTHPREWLYENRYLFAEGTPWCYTITGDALYPGRLVMRIYPFPAEQKSIDFVYHRLPRVLRIATATAGTVTLTAGSPDLVGVGTAFGPEMVGSVVRLSTSARTAPTADIGTNPAAFEATIVAVDSPTRITVDDVHDEDLAGVAHVVSDPLDIEPGAMLTALLRGIEVQISMSRTLKDKPSAIGLYHQALNEAKGNDSRSFAGRSAGQSRPLRRRLRDFPFTWTEE